MDCVYFMQGSDGLIKIGYSADVVKRYRTLKNANPTLAIRAVMPGGNRRTEDLLHERFVHFHVEGKARDWFHPNPDLLALIALLPTVRELMSVVHHESMSRIQDIIQVVNAKTHAVQRPSIRVGDRVRITAVANRTRASYGELPKGQATVAAVADGYVNLEGGGWYRFDEVEVLPKF